MGAFLKHFNMKQYLSCEIFANLGEQDNTVQSD